MIYSARRFVVRRTLCHFVLVFFSPFSIAINSLGEERANLSAFRMFDRFVLVWICRFPLPLDVWEGLRFVIVALPGLFPYLFSYATFVFLIVCSSSFLLFVYREVCAMQSSHFQDIFTHFWAFALVLYCHWALCFVSLQFCDYKCWFVIFQRW